MRTYILLHKLNQRRLIVIFTLHLFEIVIQTTVSFAADGEIQQTFGVHCGREDSRPSSRETEDRPAAIQCVASVACAKLKAY